MNHECATCNYSTKFRSNFNKHLLSSKHEVNKQREDKVAADAAEVERCTRPVTTSEMMDMFMKFQSEQTKQTTEMMKILADKITVGNVVMAPTLQPLSLPQAPAVAVQQNTVVVENNTTINNKFNLNIFLNQHCKDAINLSDFITDIEVSMEDLEHLGEVGYTQGMSRILIKALREKDTRERPIHCTDVKREVIYVRKNDAWLKDDDKEEMQRLIRNIVSKNSKKMKEWCDEHPGFQVSDSPENEIWCNISRKICKMNEATSKKLVSLLAQVTAVEKSLVQHVD